MRLSPSIRRTTALVVIDLDEATVGNDDTSQHMITTINALAHAVRQSGGVVAWVFSRMDAMPKHFTAILGHELATRYVNDGQRGGAGTRLWHALQQEQAELPIKSGASAFFPGKCDLKEQLDARGIDTILIAGAVTNICCESSAETRRSSYKVIMISDALSGQAHGLHEATLATFYRIFGDVRPSEEVIRLLR